jgi:hypothetical protein
VAVAVAVAIALGGGRGRQPTVPRPASPSPPTVPRPASPSPPTAPTFGADVGQIFQLQVFGARQIDRLLAAAAQDGLGLARVAPMWEVTEPSPPAAGRHRYDWRYDDFIADRLRANHLRWVAVLAYAPRWASQAPYTIHGAPRSAADFAAYAQAIARRYRGEIAAYEIWNEENSGAFWRPRPDPAAYARLYVAARAAIRAVDRSHPVIVGGLANGNPAFLIRLLSDPTLRGQIDGLAIHPYGRDPADVLARIAAYRSGLRALGLPSLPLYVTEFGWSTNPPGNRTYATPGRRAAFIDAVARALSGSGCGVRMVLFYAWYTPAVDRRAVNDWYGVSSAWGAPPAVNRALADAARALAAGRASHAAGCGS